MKNKSGIVACSLFLAIGALCVAAVLPVPDLAVQAACSYIGNHYTDHNASDTEYGCREYWICCSCHTIFTDVTTGKPTTGAEKISYYFVGNTTKTATDLKCNYLYKVQEVGWHYENGVPTPGPNPNL